MFYFTLTFKEYDAKVSSLDLDGLVCGLVALQLDGAGPVPHKALVTFQHKNWPEKKYLLGPRLVKNANSNNFCKYSYTIDNKYYGKLFKLIQ